MPLKPRYTFATKVAQTLLTETNISQAPIPLEKILKYLEINLMEYDFPKKVSAVLLKEGGLLVAGVNKNHHPNRRRFSIAHEIGHYKLGHHIDLIMDTEEISEGRFDTTHENVLLEQEANHFASELLMPNDLLKTDFSQTKDAKQIALKYQVSEQALWIKLMKLKLV